MQAGCFICTKLLRYLLTPGAMITQGSTVEITPPVVIIVVATRIVTAVSERYDKGSKSKLTTFLVYSFTYYFVYSLFTIYLQFVNHFYGKTVIIKT